MRKHALAAFVLVAVAVGVFFRLYHLDRKVLWSDEVFTRLRVAGLTEADVAGRAPAFRTVGALRAYVDDAGGNKPRRLQDTVGSLIAEDPQHAPVYYVVANLWVRLFGNALATERLLSAVFGILAIPCAYWLAVELFGLTSVARIFAALVAVSPFFVLYSQEYREYALWGVSILSFCACLLRGLRVGTVASLFWVALTTSFALYTDPLSLGVIVSAAVFVVVANRQSTRTMLTAVAAIAFGVASYAPWLAVIVEGRGQIARDMAWIVEARHPVAFTLQTFFGEWHLAIFDFNYVTHSSLSLATSAIVLAVIIAAFVVLACAETRRPAAFIFIVLAGSSLPLLIGDVALSGDRSGNPRYLVPFFLFEELAVAYALARGIARDRRWSAALVTVAFIGMVSCAMSAASQTWWTKYNEHSIAIADTINRTPHPIIVSDGYIHHVLSLAPYLKAGTRISLVPRCYLCVSHELESSPDQLARQVSKGDDAFLLGPSGELLRRVRARRETRGTRFRCIDVAGNCASDLRLF